jgi:hypothetical protein
MDEQNGSGKYDGWTDLKSWVTNLWLENQEPSRRYWAEQAAAWAGHERAAVELAEQLEEEVTDAAPDLGRTLYEDLMNAALSEVNWFEIAERMLEDVSTKSPEEDVSCDDSPMLSTNPGGQSGAKEAEDRFGKRVFAYSRAQAIADGVLVDVSETARKSRMRHPVALTEAVFRRYVQISAGKPIFKEQVLWDLLKSFEAVARKAGGQGEIVYSLYVHNSNSGVTWPLVQL